jgi:Ca2+-transporting ATPase
MDDRYGLTTEGAARRLQEHGPNALARDDGTPWWRLLVHQFASPMIALLVAAAVLAAALGEALDAIAIVAIVALNGIVGFAQEFQAQNAVLALRAMTAPRATVLRDGRPTVIPAAEVVPGDALLLEAGDRVAADARLRKAHDLAADEAPLTGESAPVDKSPDPRPDDTPLAERSDRVFAGTSIVRGTGLAEVEQTGMGTELGRIATLLASAVDEETPLQKQLGAVTGTLVRLCLGIVAVVAAVGLLRGERWLDVMLSAVSLAVAAVPEGLPAVVPSRSRSGCSGWRRATCWSASCPRWRRSGRRPWCAPTRPAR